MVGWVPVCQCTDDAGGGTNTLCVVIGIAVDVGDAWLIVAL